MFDDDKKKEDEKKDSAPKKAAPKKPSSGNKKIRIDEFVMPPIPKFARPVLKAHLKKVLGGKATQSEYEAEFKKFMNREIK